MQPSQALRLLTHLIPTGENVWLHGPPGVGKTDLVAQAAEAAGVALHRLPPAVAMDPVDVRGLPHLERTEHGPVTRWSPTDVWPADPDFDGVIFVDELPQASAAVMCSFMTAVQNRTIGSMRLPEKAAFVVCGNRQEDRSGVGRVPLALNDRFFHVDVEVSLDDWQDWALEHDVHPMIRAFLRFKPDQLHRFDPSLNPRSFPSPRAWHRLSGVINHVPDDLLFAAAAGRVGEAAAVEFTAYRQVYGRLPDLDEMLKHPKTCPLPSLHTEGGPALFCAVTAGLANRLKDRKGDKAVVAAYADLATRFPKEYAALAVQDALKITREISVTPSYRAWLKANGEFFNSLT